MLRYAINMRSRAGGNSQAYGDIRPGPAGWHDRGIIGTGCVVTIGYLRGIMWIGRVRGCREAYVDMSTEREVDHVAGVLFVANTSEEVLGIVLVPTFEDG